MKYRIKEEFLSQIQDSQKQIFENNFLSLNDNSFEIEIKNRGYKVNDKKPEFKKGICALSFFSGGGGLDVGTQLAGVKVISAVDFDKDSIETLKSNKYFSHTQHNVADVSNVSMNDYAELIKKNNPEKLIIVGGPPCQPFSKAGYWKTHEHRLGMDDPRNMIGHYLRIISEIQPDGVILENVESLLHPKNVEQVEIILNEFSRLGYDVKINKANSLDFGVPQKRKRVFFTASKKGINYPLTPTHGLEDSLLPYERVIDWLYPYSDEIYSDGYDSIEGKYCESIKKVSPGENYISLTERRGHLNPEFIAGKRYWSFLLKLHPLLPSWTIIASPGHWEGPFHWENRRLRIKELAAIQTFPSDYNFAGSRRSIHKQIGNAVPSLLGKEIVSNLLKNI